MKIFAMAALLWQLMAAAAVCSSADPCYLPQEETSLVQIKQTLKFGSHSSEKDRIDEHAMAQATPTFKFGNMYAEGTINDAEYTDLVYHTEAEVKEACDRERACKGYFERNNGEFRLLTSGGRTWKAGVPSSWVHSAKAVTNQARPGDAHAAQLLAAIHSDLDAKYKPRIAAAQQGYAQEVAAGRKKYALQLAESLTSGLDPEVKQAARRAAEKVSSELAETQKLEPPSAEHNQLLLRNAMAAESAVPAAHATTYVTAGQDAAQLQSLQSSAAQFNVGQAQAQNVPEQPSLALNVPLQDLPQPYHVFRSGEQPIPSGTAGLGIPDAREVGNALAAQLQALHPNVPQSVYTPQAAYGGIGNSQPVELTAQSQSAWQGLQPSLASGVGAAPAMPASLDMAMLVGGEQAAHLNKYAQVEAAKAAVDKANAEDYQKQEMDMYAKGQDAEKAAWDAMKARQTQEYAAANLAAQKEMAAYKATEGMQEKAMMQQYIFGGK